MKEDACCIFTEVTGIFINDSLKEEKISFKLYTRVNILKCFLDFIKCLGRNWVNSSTGDVCISILHFISWYMSVC